MKQRAMLLLAAMLFTSCGSSTELVIGYYPAWSRDAFPAEELDLTRLTHVPHAFAWPNADGSIGHHDRLIYPELNDRVHAEGKTILLSLGGWGHSDAFAPVAADSLLRRRFVEQVFQFVLKYQYDGVDLDWEFPTDAADRENMVLLVKDLREAFDRLMRAQKLWITMAVSAGNYYGQWFDHKGLAPFVDFFGCMTYDFHGPWTNHAGHNSPLFPSGGDADGSVSSGVAYLKSRGVPAEKIVIGVPFFGREFNAARLYGPSTGGDVSYGYAQIVRFMEQGWTYHWDAVAQVPYLTNPTGDKLITYDDTLSVRLKAEYAVKQKLRGVMIWALGQDVVSGRQPLLEAVSAPILKPTAVVSAQPTGFELKNYPNPFNHSTLLTVTLTTPERVRIELYDACGRLLRRLVEANLPAGEHQVVVDGADLSSGIYFCTLESTADRQICPITLIK